MENLYRVLFPATAFVVVILLLAYFTNGFESGDHKEDSKHIKSYEVVCKHPMGHTLKYVVDQNNWNNLYNSRNSIWRFTDIKGNSVKLSGPCFTDNKSL